MTGCAKITINGHDKYLHYLAGKVFGVYALTAKHNGGKPVYKSETDGSMYIFYYHQTHMWAVGPYIGQNIKWRLRAKSSAATVEQVDSVWEHIPYAGLARGPAWVAMPTVKAICTGQQTCRVTAMPSF